MDKWTKEDFIRMYDSDNYSDEDIIDFVRHKIKEEAISNTIFMKDFSDDEILSIAYRLYLLATNSHTDLADITNASNKHIRELPVSKNYESYANIPYGNRKIDITFGDTRSTRYLLDVDTKDIVIRAFAKIKSNKFPIDAYRSSTLCLSDKKHLSKVYFPSKRLGYMQYNDIENLIVCDRFDPVDNSTYSKHPYSQNITHRNNISNLENVKSSEEIDLIRKYYGDMAPVPHFHFGTKSYAINNRGGELAITLKNLSQYLDDLSEEYERYSDGGSGDFKLLQYDIGIPFFLLATDKMTFDFDFFYKKMKTILMSAQRSIPRNNSEVIKEFYNAFAYCCYKYDKDNPLKFISNMTSIVNGFALDIGPRLQSKVMYALQDSCDHVKQNTNKKSNNDFNRDDFLPN